VNNRKHRAVSAALAGLTLLVALAVAGCLQPFGVAEGGQTVTVPVSGLASLSITFAVPDFTARMGDAAGAGPRAIAPQTASAALLLNNVGHSEVFGDLTTSTWSGTFTGVPAGTYGTGSVTVELRDGQGNALTRGSNTAAVTVVAGQTTSGVSISCIPVNPTPLTHFTPAAGSVAANSMKYFSFEASTVDRHKIWLMDSSDEGIMMIFDSQGRLVQERDFWEGQWSETTLWPVTSGTFYVGVYGAYRYGGNPTTFSVMSADDTPALAVVWQDQPRYRAPSTHRLESGTTFDLGEFDRGQPESWNDNLRF
jgi:hypothetical protein